MLRVMLLLLANGTEKQFPAAPGGPPSSAAGRTRRPHPAQQLLLLLPLLSPTRPHTRNPLAAMAEEEEVKEEPNIVEPNFTLYINNIDEKIPKTGVFPWEHGITPRRRAAPDSPPPLTAELKKTLEAIFSQWGNVVGVYVSKALKLRGQAWVIFDSVQSAQSALDDLDGYPLNDKPVVRARARPGGSFTHSAVSRPCAQAACPTAPPSWRREYTSRTRSPTSSPRRRGSSSSGQSTTRSNARRR